MQTSASACPPLLGASVLVTGGAGSFGQAFVRRALEEGARRVVIFSRDEVKQAAMRAAFADDARCRWFLGDIRDAKRISDACRNVDVVIHAAAMKRIEACEQDPNESVQTNVVGTINVASACVERGVQRAVFLSTDKAASPNTHYGACKLAVERSWLGAAAYAAGTPTRFAATRYGNVLESTGSVVPLWRAQSAATQTVTLTDPRMTRFFMRMRDAVDLVCFALVAMRGGEVFVPKIGAASVESLALAVAPTARVQVVGIRPGEKLHETLITEDESRHAYDLGNVYVIEPDTRSWSPRGALVPAGLVYRSDTSPHLTRAELVAMVAA